MTPLPEFYRGTAHMEALNAAATVEERVAAGIALLDEKEPGWREQLDLEALVMASPCRCVLGQTFGVYSSGVKALGLDETEEYAYGFLALDSWPDLTLAWKQALE